ncbi:hypothetical protein ACQ4PT_059896 [Festuca glaucescens]
MARSWSRVVHEGSEETSARGPAFSAPFAHSGVHAGAVPRQAQTPLAPIASLCFLEYSEEMRLMEEQLRRAVVVTITGTRPVVDLADAAALLHAEFHLGPEDMSIRPLSLEDFLVLCNNVRIRDMMVAIGLVHVPWFSLSLRGWLRQAQATAVVLPYLVPLELRGVPGHAWNRRTADLLLDGFGFVVDVAAPTARRDDMSVFKVWVRALDPDGLPSERWMFVDEPPVGSRLSGRHRGLAIGQRSRTLRYLVRIRRAAEVVLADPADDPSVSPPPPPLPPPCSPSQSPYPSPRRHGGRSEGGFSAPDEVTSSGSGDPSVDDGASMDGDLSPPASVAAEALLDCQRLALERAGLLSGQSSQGGPREMGQVGSRVEEKVGTGQAESRDRPDALSLVGNEPMRNCQVASSYASHPLGDCNGRICSAGPSLMETSPQSVVGPWRQKEGHDSALGTGQRRSCRDPSVSDQAFEREAANSVWP